MPFTLEEIKSVAMSLDSTVELGEYIMRGPQENLMELESRLAWSTVAARLHQAGYTLVSPKEYAATYGMTEDAVMEKIEKEGSLFALMHKTQDETFLLVPLAERGLEPPKE